MGRRRIKLQRYDAFEERNEVYTAPDDRTSAAKVKNQRDLETLVNRRGAVADVLTDYDNSLVEYGANGALTVNKPAVQRKVESLTETVKNTRFYGVAEIERQDAQRAAELGLTVKQLRNLDARQYQTEAIATLTAARVGKVQISPYDRGVLNKLAAGEYQETVFGKEDSGGRRQFERGTFVSQYGFDRKRGGARDARAEEKARVLREYRFGDSLRRSA